MKAILLFFLFALTAQASAISGFNSWKYGMALNMHREGDSANLDVSTPRLVEYEHADLVQALAINMSLGFNNIYNQKEENNRFEIAQTFFYGLAFEARTQTSSDWQQVFSRLGAIYMDYDNSLYQESGGLGLQFAIGMDFLLKKQRQDFLGGESAPSFFVLFSGWFGFARAERLDSQPDLLNGLFLSAGIKNLF